MVTVADDGGGDHRPGMMTMTGYDVLMGDDGWGGVMMMMMNRTWIGDLTN